MARAAAAAARCAAMPSNPLHEYGATVAATGGGGNKDDTAAAAGVLVHVRDVSVFSPVINASTKTLRYGRAGGEV